MTDHLMIATVEAGRLVLHAGTWSTTIRAADIVHNWNALSHYPERRAEAELGRLAERLNETGRYAADLAAKAPGFDAAAEFERFARRHVALTLAYWASEGRCMSSFIVGPAKFPTARAQKRQRIADARGAALRDHIPATRKAMKRAAFPHGAPGEAIRGSNPDAADLLRDRIAELEAVCDRRVVANKALRKVERAGGSEADMVAALVAVGFDARTAAAIITPNYMGRRGFEAWQNTNDRANIARLKGRLAEIEAKAERGTVETTAETSAGAVEIVENVAADRVQIIFPGKPDAAVRAVLKSRGFRWAPSEGAWQRHLNEAGRDAARHVLREIGETAPAL